MTSKKVLSLVIILAFLTVITAGCSNGKDASGTAAPTAASSSSAAPSATAAPEANVYADNGLPKDEKVTLKFGFWENGYGREWIDHAIETFTKKFPNVKFDVTYSPKIDTIISTRIAANKDEDMFDIVSPTFKEAELVSLYKAGKFEPLDDLWDREISDTPGKKFKDIILDGAYENQRRYEDKTYLLPMGGYTTGLFFDKAFFEKNNWNQNPKTWDEFLKLMADIKAKGIIPLTYPGVYPTYTDYGFATKRFELAEINGTLDQSLADYKKSKLPNYLAPEFVETWKRVYELGQKGYFPQGVAALNHTQSQMLVLQHKAAIMLTGDWVQNEMKDSIPEGFKWGFMAIPFGTSPDQTKWISSGNTAGGMMIWKNKPELNKKWAKEFNLWLMTNEVQGFLAEKGVYPIRKDFAEDPTRLAKLQDAPKSVIEYVKNNKVRFETLRRDISITDPLVAQATKVFTEGITEITSGKKEPVAILEQAEKLFKQALEAQK